MGVPGLGSWLRALVLRRWLRVWGFPGLGFMGLGFITPPELVVGYRSVALTGFPDASPGGTFGGTMLHHLSAKP